MTTTTPPIQYARSADGTSIAYADYDPQLRRPLLAVPAFGFTLGLLVHAPTPAIDMFRVGTFDRRGTGHSDRAAPIRMELFVDDCIAVADALGFESFHLMGWFQGAFEAVQLALLCPDRIRGLVLQNPAPRNWPTGPPIKAWRAALEQDWDWFSESFVARRGEPDPEHPAIPRMIAEFKAANDPEPFRRIVETLAHPDNKPNLEAVSVPTFILLKDNFPSAAENYASRIPYARLVADRGGPNWDLSAQTDDALRQFFIETLPPAEVPLSWRSNEPATAANASAASLSGREVEVLRLVVLGCSNREIAATLSISLPTVATHLRHILDKLGVENRAAAAARAVRQGLA